MEAITVKIEPIDNSDIEDGDTEIPFAFDYMTADSNNEAKVFDNNECGSSSPNKIEKIKEEDDKYEEGKEYSTDDTLYLTKDMVKQDDSKTDETYCQICDKRFKTKANLRQHTKHIHSMDYFVECDLCERTFKSHAHLKSHMDCAHPKPGTEVECDDCGKVFINKKKLSNHRYYTHAAPEERVACKICNKTFKKQYKLNVHIRQVHVSNQKASCDICGKYYKNEMLMRRHAKWSHPANPTEHTCDECGKIFPSWKHYKKHKENTHSMPDGLKCELCDRTLANKKSLARHLKTHSMGKTFKRKTKSAEIPCSICDKKFATNTSLYWHKEKDHSESYQLAKSCHICLKDFTDQHVLRRHLEAVHPIETATCTVCSKTFKSAINLESHMRTTHAPPEAAKTCDVCHKTFKCGMHLRIHIDAVHPPEGGVVCDVCNRPFVSKRYLYAHKKIHVKNREFHCDICGNSFKRHVDVGKHVRKVHKKPANPVTRCIKCNGCFNNDSDLREHIISCKVGESENPFPVIKIEVTEE